MKFKRYFYRDENEEIGYITLDHDIPHFEALEQLERFGEYIKMKVVNSEDLDSSEKERLLE